MKAVDFLMRRILPEDVRPAEGTVYDQKALNNVLAEVAKRHPDKYTDILHRMATVGRTAAYRMGATLTLKDMRPVFDRDKMFKEMDDEIAKLQSTITDKSEFERAREAVWLKYSGMMQKATLDEGMKQLNNTTMSVVSGARGKPGQVQSMLTSPGVYQDAEGNIIPIFARRSFSDGVSPAEFLATTYGGRSAIVAGKSATAKGGDWAKIMAQSAGDYLVTEDDCGVHNGIDLAVDDKSIKGRVLAMDAGPFKAGTVVDRNVLAGLQQHKISNVIARSALTCRAKHGICKRCLGVLPDGKFPEKGYAIGVTAANALGEPITQGALNSKHTSGQATGKKTYSGFGWIEQFTQVPEEFQDESALADTDGMVEDVREAPQGGTYVTVAGKQHYVRHGLMPTVKVGDEVEAGDALSDGLVNPAKVVKYKGIGEGRKYYADRLYKMFDDSGMFNDRRNFEVAARNHVNHVVIDDPDEDGEYLPGDTVRFDKYTQHMKTPQDTQLAGVKNSIGKYLYGSALHYTPGTRITKKVAEDLEKHNLGNQPISAEAPKFTPEMQRLRTASHTGDDWLAGMNTSYLKQQMVDNAVRGAETNVLESHNYVPRMAVGVGFGDKIKETGKF